jgi:hypothetical protein
MVDRTDVILARPKSSDAHDLICALLDYESAARKQGLDLGSGRFGMLTLSEREFCRAELVADYIRLSAGAIADTSFHDEASLASFCEKIRDMEMPSHELIGTYLAAADVMHRDKRLSGMPSLSDSMRRTMISVLQHCVTAYEQPVRRADRKQKVAS